MKLPIRLSLGEWYFLQLIIWLGLWLFNDFVATLLTISIGAVVFAVLIIAVLSELIEPSKVPKRYFYVMTISVLAILSAAAAYVFILGGRLDFLPER